MLSVYKYEIPFSDYFELDLPKGAKVLHFDMQQGIPCLWALVEPGAPTTKRMFRFAGTGHPIDEAPAQLKFVNTAQYRSFVWHVFEVLE